MIDFGLRRRLPCKEDLPPGTFVLVDQFIDRTGSPAEKSFFGQRPGRAMSPWPTRSARAWAMQLEAVPQRIWVFRSCAGGTYLTMEGPQFSTRAESELYPLLGLLA